MFKVLITLLISSVVFSPGLTFGQEGLKVDYPQKQINKVRQKQDDTNKQIMKQRQEYLNVLKKINPELYQKEKERLEKYSEMDKVVLAFQSGRLSLEAAKNKLYPLLKTLMQRDINDLDKRIKEAEFRLQELKKAKSNPDLLINKRITQLLGVSNQPSLAPK